MLIDPRSKTENCPRSRLYWAGVLNGGRTVGRKRLSASEDELQISLPALVDSTIPQQFHAGRERVINRHQSSTIQPSQPPRCSRVYTRHEYVGVCLAGVLFLVWLFWEFYDDRRSNVPKGSLGFLPYIGETSEFVKNPAEYTAKRIEKFGNLFKGAFMGVRAVVSTDPDFSYARDTQGDHSFHISLPWSLRVMLGETYNMSTEQSGLQKLVLGILSPEGLKPHVKHIDAIILESLIQWEGQTVVEVSSACKKITRRIALFMILGNDHSEKKIHDQISDLLPIFIEAASSTPIYLPGTAYYNGYQARLKIEKLIARLIRRRTKASVEKFIGPSHNVLDALLKYQTSEGEHLNLRQISDVVCILFFGCQNPSAAAMTCTIKELCDLPSVRRKAVAECDAVEARRFFPGPLTLAEVRNMRFIQNMFKETLRKYSIVPLTVRKAKEDVEINGTLVPRGWFAVTMSCNMHMNPKLWMDPDEYNPSRFENPPKVKNYLPFGVGTHMCPGKTLAEVMVSIFFYHLLHKFKWKLDGKYEDMKIEYGTFLPTPVSKEEIRIIVSRRRPKRKHLSSPPAIWPGNMKTQSSKF
ncbi:hypothetical protein R1flu_004440 [Riccia fluitans]|uniref:Cytochrome P450 n=1 Tax=Riccia fluitans TaxID=41844 RepID=A0ABD1YQT3_9MARC